MEKENRHGFSPEDYDPLRGEEGAMRRACRHFPVSRISPKNASLLVIDHPTGFCNARALIVIQHFAFEIDLADLGRVVTSMKQRGIELHNFFGETTDVPSVFGWVPAASIYFNDPDGHLLEFVAKLPGKVKAEIGVVSLDEWNRLNQSAN